MISWIQKTFQHHFRTVFAVLLGLIIISFVFITNASSGFGRAERKRAKQPFFDLNLGSADDQRRLFGDANLSVMLQAGYQSLQESQLQQYAFARYAALHLADQLGVPAPSTEEIAAHVRTLAMFAGANGQFDAKRYSDFRDSLKTNPRLTEADISRVLSDDVRFFAVEKLISGPGYVLPEDVKSQLTLADSKWTIAVASIDYESFKPAIDAGDAALTTYFNANASRYETPPQVRVDYIDFPASAYTAQVNLTDAEVRSYYDANPARFPKPATAATTPPVGLAAPDSDFAAVRPQVEAAMRLERGRRLAAQAASDFSVTLFEGKVSIDALPGFLAAHQLALKSAPSFSEEQPPAELAGSQVAPEAFKLDATRPISDALSTASGAVILVWRESIAPAQPAFATVREQVAKDYRDEDKRRRFTELGATLHAKIEAALKSGQTFADAAKSAAEAASLKVEIKDYPAFTRRQPPSEIDGSAMSTLDTLQKGDVSPLIFNGEKGLFVYGADKAVPDLSPTSPLYVQTRDSLARRTAAMSGQSYISGIVQKELARSTPATP